VRDENCDMIVGMKNYKKGSVIMRLVIIVIVLICVGYVLYGKYGTYCSVNGVKTYGKNCSIPTVGNNTQDVYTQAMNETLSTYKTGAPIGFMSPVLVPTGYKPQNQPTLFESNSASYHYSTGKGVPADKNITFREISSSRAHYGSYDEYLINETSDPKIKVLKEFLYNDEKGVVYTYITNSKPNYILISNHEGNIIKISSTNDSNITPDILVGLLQAMKVVK